MCAFLVSVRVCVVKVRECKVHTQGVSYAGRG